MHMVIIGGSDAGISAALRAREMDPEGKSPSFARIISQISVFADYLFSSAAR